MLESCEKFFGERVAGANISANGDRKDAKFTALTAKIHPVTRGFSKAPNPQERARACERVFPAAAARRSRSKGLSTSRPMLGRWNMLQGFWVARAAARCG